MAHSFRNGMFFAFQGSSRKNGAEQNQRKGYVVMEPALKKMMKNTIAATGMLFGIAKKIDYKTLNRYIIGMPYAGPYPSRGLPLS